MNTEERFHLGALKGTLQVVTILFRGFDLYQSNQSVGVKEEINPIYFCCSSSCSLSLRGCYHLLRNKQEECPT